MNVFIIKQKENMNNPSTANDFFIWVSNLHQYCNIWYLLYEISMLHLCFKLVYYMMKKYKQAGNLTAISKC